MSESRAVEPFSASFLVDPHPTYSVLRRNEPVRPVTMPSGERVFLVTRYWDIRQGLSDVRLSNDQTKLTIGRPYMAVPAEVERGITKDLLNVDPPVHTRLRGLVADAFTGARAKDFRGQLERIADDLLGTLAEREVIDVVKDFATPFVTSATIQLLGIPPELHAPFAQWSHQIASVTFKHHDELLRPVLDLHDFVKNVIEGKRAFPAEDLLTSLIDAQREGRLSEDELTSMIHLLLIASQEGPINLISTGVFLLITHPGQRARLQANPGLLASAVDEFVRYEAPLGLGIYRCANEPIAYSGVTIPAGEPILFSLLSAGRDDKRFGCAHRLDIGRGDHNHLGFGWGRHYCLGASHGRIEGQVAIGSLFARFPDLSLAVPVADVGWQPSVITRGLSALPVNLR